jgi:hypothetical protein
MKKFIPHIFLAIILVSPLLTLGQGNKIPIISLDFGANNTWILNQNMYGNPELTYDLKFGFSGVASYKFLINKYGYSVGLGLGNLGQKYSGNMAGANAQYKINLTYLQLPVMGMYKIVDKKQQTWISFGPQINYLLSAQQNFKRDHGNLIPNPEMLPVGSTDVRERFNLIDVMLALELTQIFASKYANTTPYRANGKTMWSISLKGAIGLTDINSPKYHISSTHNLYTGSHNFFLGVHLGYMFNRQ